MAFWNKSKFAKRWQCPMCGGEIVTKKWDVADAVLRAACAYCYFRWIQPPEFPNDPRVKDAKNV
jgi:ribosome-binding protein aMBF1 (putative translation factor)